ncbi:MAG: hypothetical protein GY757_25085, partial [bacterium]|nr:hypothetical protein [bacterium]
YIKHNRLYRYEELVTVPWTDKELEITFETFRNKIKPGQKEEWRIKIRGQKGPKGEPGEKVAAEMLATLYDASLEAFRPHRWEFDIYPYYLNGRRWGSAYFGTSKSTMIGVVKKYSTYIPKDYARIDWTGYYEKLAVLNDNVTLIEEVVVTEEPPVIDTRSSTMCVSVRKKTAEVLEEIAAEKKEYRGNLRVHFTYIKHNRLYRYEELVTVPWTDKELEITFETFRNKIKPGQKEEWRIKIR